MKTLLMISAVALLFASCKNVEKLRGPIESLATDWDNTTTLVTGFVSTLQTEQQNLQDQFAQMSVPEDLNLNEETAKQVADLKAGYQEQLAGLAELSEEVNTFVGDWRTQAESMTALKDGLEAGDLGAETMGTVESLDLTVEKARSAVEDWQNELEDVKESTSGIIEQFSKLIASLQES